MIDVPIKVNDTIWRFDVNRRRYDEKRNLIYRQQFEPFVIVNETPKSWIVGSALNQHKINKKNLYEAGKKGFFGYQWFTTDGMEDNIWEHDHSHKIAELGRRANAKQLKKIAEIIDYKP